MTDTDPKMMRRQQDKDTPQHISEDETQRRTGRHDLDPESAASREAAQRASGSQTTANQEMDAVFNENKRVGDAARDSEEALFVDAATDGKASLVRRGRSILGS